MTIKPWPTEASVIINGVVMPVSACLTLRVAVESFASTIQGTLGDDGHGKRMEAGYKENIMLIRQAMYRVIFICRTQETTIGGSQP